MKKIGLIFLLIANWVVWTYHAGSIAPPSDLQLQGNSSGNSTGNSSGTWIDKSKFGSHQLILSGTPYQRGLRSGELTKDLLLTQENTLVGKLRTFIANPIVLQGFVLANITWFKGAENYLEPWMTNEMYGVSKSAPHEYDFLADGFTRQVAYHGLHEVGQMMVDQMSDDLGCTVAAIPFEKSWILGRNFDFEAGRVFDTDKIVKWVFPEQGHSFVSIIWAGMVGVVTGVNDQGLYLSINAAGSKDFRRHGTPSTLVLLKALQFASTADEALSIIKKETMFITDIFVLLDARAGKLYRIEKSPLRTEIIPLTTPSIVTNHLLSPAFANDSINHFRKVDLTSGFRQERGNQLIKSLSEKNLNDTKEVEENILAILRDKGEFGGKPLQLGNRRAIDSLIASHSVIYNGQDQILFVSQGPGVSGPFTGFDLKASFSQKRPIVVDYLKPDPVVSEQTFLAIHKTRILMGEARIFLKKKDCHAARAKLDECAKLFKEQYGYYATLGDVQRCENHLPEARLNWQKALDMHPAYTSEISALQRKLK